MTIADIARAVAIAVEGKKDGLYQKKGADWVIRFTIQAQELCDRLRDAPLGTRFQIALVQLNDDETPKEVMPDQSVRTGERPHKAPPRQAQSSGGATERRPFDSLPLPQQAGMLCDDPVFWSFIREEWDRRCENADDAAAIIRERYHIPSRSLLSRETQEGRAFLCDRDQFIAWKLVAA